METMLAENIRRFRRERRLTQEQLSEVLGVTAGAVYKWEAGLSVPELGMIVELADFFDTSVDVLIGYEMKDNRLKETVKRLKDYRRIKDRTGLAEAEKALKKYPNAFEVVHECAVLYRAFGIESGDRGMYRRTLELLEQSLLLLPQNTDPEVSEQTIYGKMAGAYLGLGEEARAVELWKAHNAGGMFDHEIGRILATGEDAEKAVPYLSEALVSHTTALIQTVMGYTNVYFRQDDFASAEAVLRLGIGLLGGLKEENRTNYLDKITGVLLAVLAGAQFRSGRTDEARATLESAIDTAERFDRDPSYDVDDLRFVSHIEGASAHDDLGTTAMESLDKIVPSLEDGAFQMLWESVIRKGEKDDG